MTDFATTKLSTKGQVVIPEEIRKALNLKSGSRFMVMGQGDTVILKSIEQPSPERFKGMMKEAADLAKKAGMQKSDVKDAIDKSRGKGKKGQAR